MPPATISEWTWPEKPWHRLHLDLADNGRQFVSGDFEQFTKMNGIWHTKTSPYNPSTNGLAERYVREFKNLLRKNDGKDDLDTNLQRFLFANRAFPQTVMMEFPRGAANEEKFKIKILVFNTKMGNPREVFHEAVRRQEKFTTVCEVYFLNYATGPKRHPTGSNTSPQRSRQDYLPKTRHPKMENQARSDATSEGNTTPSIVTDIVAQLAAALRDIINPGQRDSDLPQYDGTYPAANFFQQYDDIAGRAYLTETKRLQKLPAQLSGIAGVLKQQYPDGTLYPVQFYSRALRPHEKNYTISELECLAIIECVDKFRVYLTGVKFTIFTDHHALQWLKTIKNPTGRLFRWSLKMSTYEYEIRYIKGSKQHEADLLSRNPFCGFLSAAQIKEKQPLELPYPNATINPEGLHTLTRKGVTKVIVPPSLQHTLINKVHVEYNHPGVSQMTRIISTQYTWRGMTHSIAKYVKSCPTCQLIKRPKGPNYGTLGQLPLVSHPFDTLSIDTIAGFSKYGSSKTYLHVIVDHLSRYAWTFPSKSTSTLTYLQCLKKVMQSNTPKCLLSDRAPAFTSPKFRRFLLRHGIQPLLTTSNNPQANGLCERLNATLTGKLRILHLENPKVSWIKLIKTVTDKYNQTPHTITGFPPSFLMYNIIPTELSSHIDPYPPVEEARKIAIKRTLDRHAKEKIKYDSKHRTPQFEVGDIVLVKAYHHPNSGKLLPYFTGPYTILEIISPNVVRINRANQPLNRDNDTVHVNKLKYYTEEVLYIAPPQKYSLPNKNNRKPTNLSPYNHFPPDLFDNSNNRHVPPRSSEPFLHLTPDTFKDF
ncbi:hypothetical protein LAZ67_4001291 [Cordylochernes scorpioides]|uniref:RNA-directed DNA polymerase n=1 Tax=Cordylochernes scorpioides TaxID=51811 RepID=A0ABY6KBT2_9ARAC|nr:hypothetical protein LAZ67_4001291 [Cordylochernes scorpioides]